MKGKSEIRRARQLGFAPNRDIERWWQSADELSLAIHGACQLLDYIHIDLVAGVSHLGIAPGKWGDLRRWSRLRVGEAEGGARTKCQLRALRVNERVRQLGIRLNLFCRRSLMKRRCAGQTAKRIPKSERTQRIWNVAHHLVKALSRKLT